MFPFLVRVANTTKNVHITISSNGNIAIVVNLVCLSVIMSHCQNQVYVFSDIQSSVGIDLDNLFGVSHRLDGFRKTWHCTHSVEVDYCSIGSDLYHC